ILGGHVLFLARVSTKLVKFFAVDETPILVVGIVHHRTFEPLFRVLHTLRMNYQSSHRRPRRTVHSSTLKFFLWLSVEETPAIDFAEIGFNARICKNCWKQIDLGAK